MKTDLLKEMEALQEVTEEKHQAEMESFKAEMLNQIEKLDKEVEEFNASMEKVGDLMDAQLQKQMELEIITAKAQAEKEIREKYAKSNPRPWNTDNNNFNDGFRELAKQLGKGENK